MSRPVAAVDTVAGEIGVGVVRPVQPDRFRERDGDKAYGCGGNRGSGPADSCRRRGSPLRADAALSCTSSAWFPRPTTSR